MKGTLLTIPAAHHHQRTWICERCQRGPTLDGDSLRSRKCSHRSVSCLSRMNSTDSCSSGVIRIRSSEASGYRYAFHTSYRHRWVRGDCQYQKPAGPIRHDFPHGDGPVCQCAVYSGMDVQQLGGPLQASHDFGLAIGDCQCRRFCCQYVYPLHS